MTASVTGKPTTLHALEPLTWYEAPSELTLRAGSYTAAPRLVRDVVNGQDRPLEWGIDGPAGKVVMSAAEAYSKARKGKLRIDGWPVDRLRD